MQSEGQLRDLVTNRVPEGIRLDYKSGWLPTQPEAKRDFLADVVAFANTHGGHLIFGIEESEGYPTRIAGTQVPNIDAEVLRLENIIRDGISPALVGLRLTPIMLTNGSYCLVVTVPDSYAAPHRVTLKSKPTFYRRGNRQNVPMDDSELRRAFLASEQLLEQVRQFAASRVEEYRETTPHTLSNHASAHLLLVPLSFRESPAAIDLIALFERDRIVPLGMRESRDKRFNFDGMLAFETGPGGYRSNVAQVFRSGAIHASTRQYFRRASASQLGLVYIAGLEDELLRRTSEYIEEIRSLGLTAPFAVFVSILGVGHYGIAQEGEQLDRIRPSVDRSHLHVEPVLIGPEESDIERLMKPVLDAIWNAAGYAGSLRFMDRE